MAGYCRAPAIQCFAFRNVPNVKSGGAVFALEPREKYVQPMTETVARSLKKAATVDLSGEWLGFYTGHFDEVVRITQDGDYIEATKITGDEYVPAEEVTFRANVRTGAGEGQIAEREFRNARFVPGRLMIINSDRFIFTWENCGEVEFRRDD